MSVEIVQEQKPALAVGSEIEYPDPTSQELYIVLGETGPGAAGSSLSFKVGTCEHCVVGELGRPARAWDAAGDRELDFDRDALIAGLAALGVAVEIEAEFVCP